jgi:hypothetical protein
VRFAPSHLPRAHQSIAETLLFSALSIDCRNAAIQGLINQSLNRSIAETLQSKA